MVLPDPKYKAGDRVEIGPKTHWKSDEKYIGRKGVIEDDPWFNNMHSTLSGYCYMVDLGDGGVTNFFEEDFVLAEGIDYEIAKLKAQVAELEVKKDRVEKTKLPPDLQVASSIFFPPNQLVIKVAKDKWHWYSVDKDDMQFHSTSTDKPVKGEIVVYLDEEKAYQVHRPTDL